MSFEIVSKPVKLSQSILAVLDSLLSQKDKGFGCSPSLLPMKEDKNIKKTETSSLQEIEIEVLALQIW